MKTIFELHELHILEQDKHGKFDDINQRITLSVITLSGFTVFSSFTFNFKQGTI